MNASPTATPGPRDFAARAYDAVKVFGAPPNDVRALDGLTIGFEASRFNVIMGASGSGKSTLLHCIAGLDYLSEGRVFLGERELTGLDPTQLTLVRRDHMGFVFQSFNLLSALTAEENIVLPAKLAKRPVDRAHLDEVIALLRIGDRLHHRPAELSGGQQQRVAVARALVMRPEVIFADEPTGNLDSRSSDDLLTYLRHAVDVGGTTVVMVTHDPRAAARGDRISFLADGRHVETTERTDRESIIERLKELGR